MCNQIFIVISVLVSQNRRFGDLVNSSSDMVVFMKGVVEKYVFVCVVFRLCRVRMNSIRFRLQLIKLSSLLVNKVKIVGKWQFRIIVRVILIVLVILFLMVVICMGLLLVMGCVRLLLIVQYRQVVVMVRVFQGSFVFVWCCQESNIFLVMIVNMLRLICWFIFFWNIIQVSIVVSIFFRLRSSDVDDVDVWVSLSINKIGFSMLLKIMVFVNQCVFCVVSGVLVVGCFCYVCSSIYIFKLIFELVQSKLVSKIGGIVLVSSLVSGVLRLNRVVVFSVCVILVLQRLCLVM